MLSLEKLKLNLEDQAQAIMESPLLINLLAKIIHGLGLELVNQRIQWMLRIMFCKTLMKMRLLA